MSYLGNTPTQQSFTPAIDYFSGNGSTTVFTLSRPVASSAQVQVVVNNVAQNPSTAFTVLNNTITFTGAPSTGTNNIYVQYTSPITQVIAPSQGTVGTAQLQDGAVITQDIADGAVTPIKMSQKLTSGTAVASTSGTSIDFTSIPSWVKRITVMFAGVSVSGTSNILVQLGAGSVTTAGYLGGAWAANTINTTITTGLAVTGTNEAARRINGLMTIANVSGNTWASSVVTFDNINNNGGNGGSYIALAGTLDRVRVTTVNGTDTFDAGSINILYEG